MGDEADSTLNSTLNSLDCWDYTIELECLKGTSDLQLAAELGKTLLERNKELEAAVKQLQIIHDDQVQEIEYLQKQSTALKEVNDSRLRVYEQLEVSIQELERANHRLGVENAAQRRQIRGLNATIEALESRCEDLQASVDELKLQVEVLRKRKQRTSDANLHPIPNNNKETVTLRHVDRRDEERSVSPDSSGTKCVNRTPPKAKSPPKAAVKPDSQPTMSVESQRIHNIEDLNQLSEYLEADSGFEQMSQMLAQLRESRVQCSRFERRIVDLEEQLAASDQQNRALEDQVIRLAHKEEDAYAKSMHEELTTLEEVRQGQMCSRCLRSMDQTSGGDAPEDDDSSMLEELMAASQHRSSFSLDVQAAARLRALLHGSLGHHLGPLGPPRPRHEGPLAGLLAALVDLCLYIKDAYLVPLLSRPVRLPIVVLHYCLRHKLH